MAWFYLLAAGILECVWSTLMKLSDGFSHLGYAIGTVVGLIGSMVMLIMATKSLPIGLAYPIWTGIGAVGAVIIGVVVFGDKVPLITWLFVALLIIGIIGIKVTSGR